MIQLIKRLLFKRDYEELQKAITKFEETTDNYDERFNELDTNRKRFIEEKYEWETLQKIEYRAKLEKENLELLQNYKDKLETLIDYRLIPWVKVWVFTPSSQWKPKQIEIEAVYINKEKVSINNDMYLKYFHSEKEAVDFYNNYLDKQKITLDSNS